MLNDLRHRCDEQPFCSRRSIVISPLKYITIKNIRTVGRSVKLRRRIFGNYFPLHPPPPLRYITSVHAALGHVGVKEWRKSNYGAGGASGAVTSGCPGRTPRRSHVFVLSARARIGSGQEKMAGAKAVSPRAEATVSPAPLCGAGISQLRCLATTCSVSNSSTIRTVLGATCPQVRRSPHAMLSDSYWRHTTSVGAIGRC